VTRRLIVEADGGSRGNPGPAGFGAVVRDQATGELLREISGDIGAATNNVAEYSGLIAGLRAAAEIAPGADVEARMDSKLVVEQMSGRWQIKHQNLRSLARTAQDAAARLGQVRYTWVPRARNAHADRLANEAMDSAGSDHGAARARRPRPRQPAPESGPAAAEPDPARARGWAHAEGQPTTTILLRHGQTEFSAERRFAGRGDIALTDLGRRQAAAAADRLAHRGIDAIVTSPLQRARRTAEAVAAATGAPLAVDDELTEADFGKWEGLTFGEAARLWPDEIAAWLARADAAPPGGESLADASRRAAAVLGRLLAARPRQTLLLVSHVTPIKALACRALLAPPAALFRMHLDVASLTEIDWYADGPAVLRSLNDTAHLRLPGQ
jgi:ribonuclease H / adenosylcobalamin/alpha-ribazole phosphatase